ncbi:molybdopterin synthase sulfur carrier subunit [Candidatus Pantoea edessiphila]|uniref:Molybdopterin synthase sulfur carrier subunit n=1 Tax=Candidatus Pantoea edessiphila TaxID=2044610 RepID=A0A2P5SX31_9GAMM|nr:molybdopterin synthase sulfur carrier subunit [Candidatus Pantoea edessiphila]PPI86891.1 molybdopterin synthase sulfur carrier subunit [Candidatus Pantoea edessiphila]
MIKVLFFAKVREIVGINSLDVLEDYTDIKSLVKSLSQRGESWKIAFSSDNLLVAVNHELVSMSNPIHSGDEVAFFPPVTGG